MTRPGSSRTQCQAPGTRSCTLEHLRREGRLADGAFPRRSTITVRDWHSSCSAWRHPHFRQQRGHARPHRQMRPPAGYHGLDVVARKMALDWPTPPMGRMELCTCHASPTCWRTHLAARQPWSLPARRVAIAVTKASRRTSTWRRTASGPVPTLTSRTSGGDCMGAGPIVFQ